MNEEFEKKPSKHTAVKLSKENKQRVFTVVLSIVTLLTLLLSVTFSWFITTDYLIVHPFDVAVSRPAYLRIGTIRNDCIDWNSELNVTLEAPLFPVCGDGTHFFSKLLFTTDQSAYSNPVKSGSGYNLYGLAANDDVTEISQEEYHASICTVDFVLEAGQVGNLYLSSESALNPNLFLSPMSSELFGVSTGYIAGAIRVAIFQKDASDTYQLKCIWIPNATFEFNAATSSFHSSGTVESSYSFVSPNGSDTKTTVISTVGNTDGYTLQDGVLYVWDLDKCNEPFASYAGPQDKNFRAVIWLDGTDRECINALAGGKADLKLGIYIE